MSNPNAAYWMQVRAAKRGILKFALESAEDVEQASARLGIPTVLFHREAGALGGVFPGSKPNEPWEPPFAEETLAAKVKATFVERGAPTMPNINKMFEESARKAKQRQEEEIKERARLDKIATDDLIALQARANEALKALAEEEKEDGEEDEWEDDEEDGDEEDEDPEEEDEEDEEGEERADFDDEGPTAPAWRKAEAAEEAQPISDNPAPTGELRRRPGRGPAISPDPSKFCTYKDAANIIGMSISSIHQMRNSGKLKPIKMKGIVLFDRQTVDAIAIAQRRRRE